jgi:hypothetical protein
VGCGSPYAAQFMLPANELLLHIHAVNGENPCASRWQARRINKSGVALNRAMRLVGIVSLSDLAREGRRPDTAGLALGRIAREGGQHRQSATG